MKMKIPTLDELYLHELRDVYDAENQLVDALPKMAKAASDSDLRAAFENHLKETRGHVSRLEVVFHELGERPERETCKGMKGLLAEGEKLLDQDAEPAVRDAALITAAQRVEHYEIAAYGSLKTWAGILGHEQAVEQLEATLSEEKTADETLTELAETRVNVMAAEASEATESAQDEESEMRPRGRSATSRKPSPPARSRRSMRPRH